MVIAAVHRPLDVLQQLVVEGDRVDVVLDADPFVDAVNALHIRVFEDAHAEADDSLGDVPVMARVWTTSLTLQRTSIESQCRSRLR